MDSLRILEHSFLTVSEGFLRELSEVKPKRVMKAKAAPVKKRRAKKPKLQESVIEVKPTIKEDMTHFNDHFETLIENEVLRESLSALGKALKKERKLFNEQLTLTQSKLTHQIRTLEEDKQRLIQEQEELKSKAETEQTETDQLRLRMQTAAGLNPHTYAEKQEISKDE